MSEIGFTHNVKGALGFGGFRPDAGGPKHGGNEEGLKRKPDPFHPRLDGNTGKLDVIDGHINIGGENGNEQQNKGPTGKGQADDLGKQKAQAAQQFAYAAGDDAKEMEGNERGHDGEEERRAGQMDRAGEEEK